MPDPSQNSLRLAELLASLSLAIDLGTGQPLEWVLRSTLLGVQLAKALGLSEAEQHEVYYLALLRHVGCTAYAHQDAALFGDELSVADGMTLDMDDMQTTMAWLFRSVGKGLPTLTRIGMIARIMSAGPHAADANHLGHCEVGERVAQTLGLSARIQQGLRQVYERWDGKGLKKIKGADILRPVCIIQLAQDAVTFAQAGGVEAATAMVRARVGRYFEPTLAEFFCTHALDLLQPLQTTSTWDAVLAAEPSPAQWLTAAQFDAGAQVVADFGDMKSPFTLGHSSGVADLAAQVARQCNLPESDEVALRRAGLLHDIGRVGVSAGIWGKPGALSDGEWERVRMHPYYTERVLARTPALAPLGELAASHHERLDGSGYHRRMPAAQLSLSARILAVADVYRALCEARPHRPAFSADQAATELQREAKAGRLDVHAVDALLAVTGQKPSTTRRAPSTELSEREIEVLRLVARGLSNKEMAQRLSISPKTVGHHIQHIYDKIGVSTRAGATLYAMQNHLL